MPYKDKEKAKEYKRLWIAKKRSQQFVEPIAVEPLKKGWALTKCAVCPQLVSMEEEYIPYFAPFCSSDCVRKRQKNKWNYEKQ